MATAATTSNASAAAASSSSAASGALHSGVAHVYLEDQGIDLQHETVEFAAYDDGTSQLLVVKGGHVFAYDVGSGDAPHNLRWMYPLQVCWGWGS